jgi:addiction module RelE/StbE family toxin
MRWKIISTETFSREFRKYQRGNSFVQALNKKIDKLKENPESVGGELSGNLHGYRSTRIIGKFRLIFKIMKEENSVYLAAIDHRKFDYKRFNLE